MVQLTLENNGAAMNEGVRNVYQYAMHKAISILHSRRYATVFRQCVEGSHTSLSLDHLQNCIQNAQYEVRVGMHNPEENETAYAGVYREALPNVICISLDVHEEIEQLIAGEYVHHPGDAYDENETAQENVHTKLFSAFLTIKLVHEASHLLRFTAVPASAFLLHNDLITPPKLINNIVFADFGEMMEKVLFGGVSCLKTWINNNAHVERIIVFPGPLLANNHQTGREIHPDAVVEFLNRSGRDCRLRLGQIYRKPGHSAQGALALENELNDRAVTFAILVQDIEDNDMDMNDDNVVVQLFAASDNSDDEDNEDNE